MIKGCSKRMIVLKNTGSELFDEAYFVVKPHRAVSSFKGEKAFIDEAHRILNEAGFSPSYLKSKERPLKSVFFSGALCGLFFGFACAAIIFISI